MSSAQKKFKNEMQSQSNAANAQIAADRNRILQDSPQLAFLRGIAKRGADWISAKDYRQPVDGLFDVNLSDPAKRQAMRKANMNLAPTGATALGMSSANPTALAMARMAQNDELDRDSAQAYETGVKTYIGDVMGLNRDLTNYDFTRDQSLLGNATNRWQYSTGQWGDTARQMGSIVPGIIGSALGAGGQILGGYLGGGRS